MKREDLAAMYEKHHRIIFSQLRGRVERQDTEDVLHVILDRMLAGMDRMRNMDEIRQAMYIRSIARNAAMDYLRARIRHRSHTADAPDEDLAHLTDPQCVEDVVLRRDALSGMKRAIAALPMEKRDLLEMKYVQEMDDAQIARHLGISRVNVRQRLSRLRRELRTKMEEMGYEE